MRDHGHFGRYSGAVVFMQGLSLTEQDVPVDFDRDEHGYRISSGFLDRYHSRVRAATSRSGSRPEGRVGGLVAIVPPDGELEALLDLRDRARTQEFLRRVVELYGPQTALGIGDPVAEAAPMIVRLASFLRIHAVAATPVDYTEAEDAAAAAWWPPAPSAGPVVDAPD